MLTRDDQHRYFWQYRMVPGVTEIIQEAGYINTDWYTAEGRERGKHIHEMCELFLIDPEHFDWDLVVWDWRGYVESCAQWIDAVRPEVIATEEMLYSETWGYAGQIDWLVKTTCGEFWVIDGKSAVTVAKSTGIQTAAYANLQQERGLVGCRRGALRLRADGKQGVLVPYEDEQDWDDFLHALGVWNAKRRLGIT